MCEFTSSSAPVAAYNPEGDAVDSQISSIKSFYSSSISRTLMPSVLGVVTGVITTGFSMWLPFVLFPAAANKTYILALYEYDPSESLFDNTAWTYGTDAGLGCLMSLLSCLIWFSDKTVASRTVRRWSIGLLLCYVVSVVCGAIAHFFYTNLEDRNTWHFRCLWTVCVSTVCLPSSLMGCIGSELVRKFKPSNESTSTLPVMPEAFWMALGFTTTLICAAGYFSYQRPACDIFIAGITQFPSSFYLGLVQIWHLRNNPYVHRRWRYIGGLSFVSNAPLLPLYPVLVQYTDWSLASVNTFLHCWLCVSWTAQALCMVHCGKAVGDAVERPQKAIPLKKKGM